MSNLPATADDRVPFAREDEPPLPSPPTEEPLSSGVTVETNAGAFKLNQAQRTPIESPTATTGGSVHTEPGVTTSTSRAPSTNDVNEEAKVATGSDKVVRRSTATKGPPASKDNTFYFSSLFVQLSDKTVTIPRQPLFEKSTVLRKAVSNKNVLVGSTAENPVKFDWTSSGEFGTFMDELLGFSEGKLDSKKWICVLKVADRLQVPDLRELAINNLEAAVLPHHTILELAHGHNLTGDRWRRLSFEEIVLAPTLPTLDEAEAIGWSWMLRLAKLRERRLFENVNFYHRPVQLSKISSVARRSLPLVKPKKVFAYCQKDNLSDDIYPNSDVEFPPVFQRSVLESAYKKAFDSMETSTTNDDDMLNADSQASGNSQESTSNRAFNVSYLVLKVDKTLFRLPRNLFEEKTSTFMSRYDITDEAIGSEEDPVVLDDVSVDDFKSFLKCATNTSSSWEQKEVWVAAIKLSRMWHLKRPRATAIAKLEAMKLDPVTRIELARTCGIDNWLRPAMTKLALQRSSPSEATAKSIGYDTTMRLLQLREEIVPERQRVLYTLLLKDAEEKKDDPKNMKCRFCGTHFLPDVSCVDLSEEEIVSMVRKLVAEELCGTEMPDEQRDKSKGLVSRKHLTRRGALGTPHALPQEWEVLKLPTEAPHPAMAATA